MGDESSLRAGLDREIERTCSFNCDAESSCDCAAHRLYRAVADLLRAQPPSQTACIACGAVNEGGYEVEDGPGPFCADCWERLEACFGQAQPPPALDPPLCPMCASTALANYTQDQRSGLMCLDCQSWDVSGPLAAPPAVEPPPAHDPQTELRLKLAERQLERLALCPDHRDKATGRCIVCQAEERTKQELRAALPAVEGTRPPDPETPR